MRRWQARSRCAKCAVDGHSSETSELASSERRLGLPGHAHARHEAGAHPRDAVRVALTPRRACAGGYCWCPGWSVRPRRTRPIRAVGPRFNELATTFQSRLPTKGQHDGCLPHKCFAAGTVAAVRGDGPQPPAVLSILEPAMVMHVIIQLLTAPASTTGVPGRCGFEARQAKKRAAPLWGCATTLRRTWLCLAY